MDILKEIVNKYAHFSDATIFEVCSSMNESYNRNAHIILSCQNQKNNNIYEIVKLYFIDVKDFRFVEIDYGTSSRTTFEVLIQEDNDSILFDFFPLIKGRKENGTLELCEDEDSNLKIRCKKIHYEKLND